MSSALDRNGAKIVFFLNKAITYQKKKCTTSHIPFFLNFYLYSTL